MLEQHHKIYGYGFVFFVQLADFRSKPFWTHIFLRVCQVFSLSVPYRKIACIANKRDLDFERYSTSLVH